MPKSRPTNAELVEENQRLRAQVAQLEDRLDHISEHGAAAKALQQSESLHRDIMGVVADVALISDDAGRLAYVSPNAHFIFGHAPHDIMKQGRIAFLLPGDLFDPDVLEQRGEIANIECQIRDAIGRARNLLVTVRRIDRHGGTMMYVCRDVTERMKIELDYELLSLTLERRVEERTNELRQSHDRYRRLVEGLREDYLFYATSPEGTITYVTPSIYSVLGYTPDEVIGRNWREFVDADGPDLAELERLERLRFAGMPTPLYCAPVRHADGHIVMLESRDVPLRDANGRVIANEGICKDVTRRHRAEEALRRAHEELEQRVQERTAELKAMNDRLRDSERRYRSVVDDQLEYIVRWRDDGVRTFVNKSYCRARGAAADQLIGTSFMPGIVEEDREALMQKLATVSRENPVVIDEHRVVRSDGHVCWERWSNRALFDEDGRLIEFQSVGHDVTERRKLEKQAEDRALAAARLRALSDRERDVMRLVVAGDANKVIARKLDLSIKTIEKHRSSLMKKLHIRSVPELVRLALLVEASSDL
ncbi:MAG TPA: PAS domain S-box protein [Lacipirellulaceae bacterium]|nr:PAS domain S-box protein [Lacipirellulaceae bacterium]